MNLCLTYLLALSAVKLQIYLLHKITTCSGHRLLKLQTSLMYTSIKLLNLLLLSSFKSSIVLLTSWR